MTLLLAAVPLVLLIAAMSLPIRVGSLRLPLPAHVALPAAAGVAMAIALVRLPELAPLGFGSRVLAARVVDGLLSSLTPLAIVFGAVLLFAVMDRSGAMAVLTGRLKRLSPDPVGQVLLVGFAFTFLVEGLSGFGTPAALAAPVLVGLGFAPIRVAAACLVFNSVPVSFGAVGTPMWFGLGELALSDDQLSAIAWRTAVTHAAAAPVIVAIGVGMLVPWRDIVRRWWLVLAVVAAAVVPYVLVALVSLEFPSIAGGLSALAAAAGLARLTQPKRDAVRAPAAAREVGPAMPFWKAAAPLVLVVVLLTITRLEPLGLRSLLTSATPEIAVSMGPLGEIAVSASLVVAWRSILGTGVVWSMALLYVPFVLPFIVVALFSWPLLSMDRRQVRSAWAGSVRRLVCPAIALAGALVLVKVLMHGGEGAPVMLIGSALARGVTAVDPGLWVAVAPMLGALGAFFSGSATVSNLTFAPVQVAVVEQLGLQAELVLAMQSVGGAMGNMVCIHNIVAVAAVLGLTGVAKKPKAVAMAAGAEVDPADEAAPVEPVSTILRRTILPMLIYAAIAGAAGLVLGQVA